MTKLTKRLFVLAFGLLTSITSQSQELKGVIAYKTKTTIDLSRLNRGGEQMSEQRKKQIMERLKNFSEKEYTLTFINNESFYKEEEALESPVAGGGVRRFGGGSAPGGIYKNIEDNAYVSEVDMFGKKFLIKDTLNNLKWELVKESKVIGDYPVFKAVAKRPLKPSVFSRLSRRIARGGETKESAITSNTPEEKEPEIETIVAWYTPMIPASHGPNNFDGLPGLILELNTANTTTLCSKIVLNPSQEIEIKAPTKGKKVTREEYTQIIEEKTKEMSKRFKGGARGGNGRFGG